MVWVTFSWNVAEAKNENLVWKGSCVPSLHGSEGSTAALGIELIKAAILFPANREHLTGFTDVSLENGSSQGQNLALTGVCVPILLDSGAKPSCAAERKGNP